MRSERRRGCRGRRLLADRDLPDPGGSLHLNALDSGAASLVAAGAGGLSVRHGHAHPGSWCAARWPSYRRS